MSQRFAQISDLHLSSLDGVRAAQLLGKRLLGYLSWRRKRRFEHRLEVLDALRTDLAQQQLDQLLVTGDLTHIGLPEEFSQARDWLRQVDSPANIALVPGNHDACVRERWQDTFALWEDYMASDTAQVAGRHPFPCLRNRGDITFIGLSSGCPTPPLMATGTIADEELAALPELLDAAARAGRFRVLFLHHSPVRGQEKWRKRLTNAGTLANLIAEHGAELVLHGHGHRARYDELPGPRGPVPVIAVPSASALGLHGADVAAYNQYEVRREDANWRLDVTCRRFNPGQQMFAAGETRTVLMPGA